MDVCVKPPLSLSHRAVKLTVQLNMRVSDWLFTPPPEEAPKRRRPELQFVETRCARPRPSRFLFLARERLRPQRSASSLGGLRKSPSRSLLAVSAIISVSENKAPSQRSRRWRGERPSAGARASQLYHRSDRPVLCARSPAGRPKKGHMSVGVHLLASAGRQGGFSCGRCPSVGTCFSRSNLFVSRTCGLR